MIFASFILFLNYLFSHVLKNNFVALGVVGTLVPATKIGFTHFSGLLC